MVARVQTVAFQGLEVVGVDAQVRISTGLPSFTVVGLPDKAVAESRERVRAALGALGLALPPNRITVNLAPADLLKEGSHFDLPIALALLVEMGALPADGVAGYTALGELALDGRLEAVAGVLPAASAAGADGRGLICPAAGGGEAAWAGETEVLAPATLLELVNHFKGTQVLNPPEPAADEEPDSPLDLADIKGQEVAKRALEVAAAGAHNLLMIGPPGAGKSMLAARLLALLPPLDAAEILEVSMIASIAGQLAGGRISRRRPFRDPHHSASMPAMVGGGAKARPGEVSLAHLGVLFLDELPEFSGIMEQAHLKSPKNLSRYFIHLPHGRAARHNRAHPQAGRDHRPDRAPARPPTSACHRPGQPGRHHPPVRSRYRASRDQAQANPAATPSLPRRSHANRLDRAQERQETADDSRHRSARHGRKGPRHVERAASEANGEAYRGVSAGSPEARARAV